MAKKIASKYIGKVKCARWDTKVLVCVTGMPYGFKGTLYGGGKRSKAMALPVPTGNARTPKEALAQARRFLVRTYTASRK